MPLETPAPRFFRARRAEDADVVFLRVALSRRILLHFPEDRFQRHNQRRLFVALIAQPGLGECHRKRAGLGRHLLNRESLPFTRDKVPVLSFLGAELEYGLRLLLGGKFLQQSVCGLHHVRRSGVKLSGFDGSVLRKCRDCESDCCGEECFHRADSCRNSAELQARSHAALGRRPDELVHLKLKTHRKFVGDNPVHDLPWFNFPEDRRKQYTSAPLV